MLNKVPAEPRSMLAHYCLFAYAEAFRLKNSKGKYLTKNLRFSAESPAVELEDKAIENSLRIVLSHSENNAKYFLSHGEDSDKSLRFEEIEPNNSQEKIGSKIFMSDDDKESFDFDQILVGNNEVVYKAGDKCLVSDEDTLSLGSCKNQDAKFTKEEITTVKNDSKAKDEIYEKPKKDEASAEKDDDSKEDSNETNTDDNVKYTIKKENINEEPVDVKKDKGTSAGDDKEKEKLDTKEKSGTEKIETEEKIVHVQRKNKPKNTFYILNSRDKKGMKIEGDKVSVVDTRRIKSKELRRALEKLERNEIHIKTHKNSHRRRHY
ncbi:hypothetical protein ENBRE01_3352 [Enteropsectra breve]|nr:hypothetical protein ENBRE01_3352 [Enteropsectra breve]